MIWFIVEAGERDSDRIVYDDFRWPVLPRIGEAILIAGEYETVHNIRHDLGPEENCIVMVCIEVDPGELQKLEEQGFGENIPTAPLSDT